jgi:Histidine phosphatase superfamily (branch 1)
MATLRRYLSRSTRRHLRLGQCADAAGTDLPGATPLRRYPRCANLVRRQIADDMIHVDNAPHTHWRVSDAGPRSILTSWMELRPVRGPDVRKDSRKRARLADIRGRPPGGETPEQIGTRVDRVIARARVTQGDVALFAHGRVPRVPVARWIGHAPRDGQHFLLDTGTLCALSHYRDAPAIKIWNGPLVSRRVANDTVG